MARKPALDLSIDLRAVVKLVLGASRQTAVSVADAIGADGSAIAHWFRGRNLLNRERALALLELCGLASDGVGLRLSKNEELLKPRIWHFRDADTSHLEEIFSALPALKPFDLWSTAIPGVAVVMPAAGNSLVVIAGTPQLIQSLGATNLNEGEVIPACVIEQILSGDIGLFLDLSKSLRFGSLKMLEIGSEISALANQEDPEEPISSRIGWFKAWAGAIEVAENKGISPHVAGSVILKFSELSAERRVKFLTGG